MASEIGVVVKWGEGNRDQRKPDILKRVSKVDLTMAQKQTLWSDEGTGGIEVFGGFS